MSRDWALLTSRLACIYPSYFHSNPFLRYVEQLSSLARLAYVIPEVTAAAAVVVVGDLAEMEQDKCRHVEFK